ncbi:MAG: MBL fold metallo-hydrolase [Tannerella sp.]|jgi:L-ascorbate metabolism protein UlaG (beta-lactamase superfamily)|nr:MBL fold metallo-hydrolase [Tannerella sp.]
MKLTYIYHSGFVIEGKTFALIVDYFQDTDDVFVRKHIPLFAGRVYVLVSHRHPDHFNPEILRWKRLRRDIQYIFSKDILEREKAKPADAAYLAKGDTWCDDTVSIRAFGSTDTGVSFLIDAEGKRIFHAGDLNNWHWSEDSTPAEIQTAESDFLAEVDLLAQSVDRLDLAMFPVDARLGRDYMRGAEQFVDRIRVAVFSPMHFTSSCEAAEAFRPYAERAGCRFAGWKAEGESIDF